MIDGSPELKKTIQSDLLLLLVAAIWGLAFVAQREGASNLPPILFVAIRYLLGAVSLLPVIWFLNKKEKKGPAKPRTKAAWLAALPGGLSMGAVLFLASFLQQSALVTATAGQAGFITSLYVVLVPIMGIFLGRYRLNLMSGASLIIAVIGLYLLSVQGELAIAGSDLILIVSAFLYALHIILIEHFSPKTDSLRLSTLQFLVAGVIGLVVSLIMQVDISWAGIQSVLVPLLYTGIFSSGVAYTLQIFAQRHAQASHAAIIMSSESVFAAVGGMIFLSEVMQGRAIVGALLMFGAGVISQLSSLATHGFWKKKSSS